MSKKFKNFCLYAFYAVVILAALFSLFAPTIEGFPVPPQAAVVASYGNGDTASLDEVFDADPYSPPGIVAGTTEPAELSGWEWFVALIRDFFNSIAEWFANIFSSGSAQVAAEEVAADLAL